MKKRFLTLCFSILCYSSFSQFAKEWKTYYSESFATENSNFKINIGDGKPQDFQFRNGRIEINNQTDYSHKLICNTATPMLRSVHPVHRIKANLGFISEPASPNSKNIIFINWNMGHIGFGKDYLFNLMFNSDGEYGFDYYRQDDYSNSKRSPLKNVSSFNKGANKTNELVIEIELPKLRFYFNNTLVDSITVKGPDNENRELQELTFSNSMNSKFFIEDITVSCQQYEPYVKKGTLDQLFPILMAAGKMDVAFTPLIGHIDTTCQKKCNRDYYLPTSLQLSNPKSVGFVSPRGLNFTIPMSHSSKADYLNMENMVKKLYNSLQPQSTKFELVGRIEKVQMEQDGDKILVGFFSPKVNLNFDIVRIYYDYKGVHVEIH